MFEWGRPVVSCWLVSAVEVCSMAGEKPFINCKACTESVGSVRNAFDCKLQRALLTVFLANEFIFLP